MIKSGAAFLAIVLPLLCLDGCAPAPMVRPRPKGGSAVSASLGGPLMEFSGLTIPMPFILAGYEYGLKDNLTLSGELDATALLFGVFHVKAGALYGILAPQGLRPGLSVSPALHLMLDCWEWHFRVNPQADVNAWWTYGQRGNLVYTGLENWFELKSENDNGQEVAHHWIPAIKLGHVLVRKKMQYTLELKYIAPQISNSGVVVEYRTPFDNGALGIYLGLARTF